MPFLVDTTGRPGTCDLGRGQLPIRRGRLPGARRQLVRSRRLRRVRRQAASDHRPLAQYLGPQSLGDVMPQANLAGGVHDLPVHNPYPDAVARSI